MQLDLAFPPDRAWSRDYHDSLRRLWSALCRGDEADALAHYRNARLASDKDRRGQPCGGRDGGRDGGAHPLIELIGETDADATLAELPDSLARLYIEEVAIEAMLELTPLAPAVSTRAERLLQALPGDPGQNADLEWAARLAEYHALRGEAKRAESTAAASARCGSNEAAIAAAAARRDWPRVIDHGDRIARDANAGVRAPRMFRGISGLLYVAALAATGDASSILRAHSVADRLATAGEPFLHSAYAHLRAFCDCAPPPQCDCVGCRCHSCCYDRANWPSELARHLIRIWNKDDTESDPPRWETGRLRDEAHDGGFIWLAQELATPDSAVPNTLASGRRAQPRWEQALNSLTAVAKISVGSANLAKPPHRLTWRIEASEYELSMEPYLQKQKATGAWSLGRKISLARLVEAEQTDEPWLTDADRRVLSYVIRTRDRPYSRERCSFSAHAPLALVKHPQIYWQSNPTRQVRVRRAAPELVTQETDGGIRIQIVPAPGPGPLAFERGAGDVLQIYLVDADHRRVAAAMERDTLFPPEAAAKLRAALPDLAKLVAVSPDPAPASSLCADIAADARPHVQIRRHRRGVSVALRVFPLGAEGPDWAPGEGPASVLATVDGARLRTERNLASERELASAVVAGCSALAGDAARSRWEIPDLAASLGLLTELRALGDSAVVQWCGSKPMRLQIAQAVRDMRLFSMSAEQWLRASGYVEVDEGRTLELHELLTRLDRTDATGQFVALDDSTFLALSDELRAQLDQLAACASVGNEEIRVHPAAVTALAGWANHIKDLDLDQGVEERLERLRAAQALTPEAPSSLRAELRNYQREGFEWMSRLAHWGAGACLADDMGLGKTVQTLAILLARSDDGPALVTAPTSVCPNWLSEARRFAPDLRVHDFRQANRTTLIDRVGPGDVVVCSYGLMVRDRDAFAGTEWSTLVWDEAQSIKNPIAQRSRAARAIPARFRLALTGTPVENHLGDLWSIFDAINPGLLGTAAQFQERFAKPIQRDGNARARARLKALIGPFVLRRTKAEVLPELPQRTEIVIAVEPSEEERALYEATRRDAKARLQHVVENGPTGARRFAILAEITRLRRLSCHPRLVMPDWRGPASKLDCLASMLRTLRASGHRALVFSQFVGFLELVRERLDTDGIAYQYLDGSTPSPDRAERVRAFQDGAGEAFLISLRAGGFGLNLTGADYVLHLDSWWNPAVEDQASDRAHRIGQSRPVTVCRLVTAGSIEETVLDLHAEKRRVASEILTDTDTPPRLGTDELLSLLSEPSPGRGGEHCAAAPVTAGAPRPQAAPAGNASPTPPRAPLPSRLDQADLH